MNPRNAIRTTTTTTTPAGLSLPPGTQNQLRDVSALFTWPPANGSADRLGRQINNPPSPDPRRTHLQISSPLGNRQPAIDNRQFSSGFTLIEVLAVLAIFMILLGVTLYPASKWHRQQRIRSAVGVVQTALRLAREQAMTRREVVCVSFTNQIEGDIRRAYYCLRGANDLGTSNAIPDGLSFFTIVSTNVTPGDYAVLISGDRTTGDWAIISNLEYRIEFDPAGRVDGLLHIGIVEYRPPGESLSPTGFLAVTENTGYITSFPSSP